MSMTKEFRDFIARGNVVDLAVGVVIGGAFGAIVKSLVDEIIMPPIGLLLGNVDFSKLEWVLRPENPLTDAVEKVAIGYGGFINTIIQFLIVAMAIFFMVKAINSARREAEAEPEAPAAPPADEVLLTEIRDLLKAGAKPAPAAAAARKPAAPKKA
ncbi:MAG: large-conductance mechanosensitive channel protein MscL [Caulobacter sp.]|nr:large-conductance mechanosensitive channel protein MscL [Caulobacter sp.]